MSDDPALGGATFGEGGRRLRDWSSGSGGSDGEPQDPHGRGVEFRCVEFCPICRSADVLRATMPPEFRDHWQAWQRELLLSVRALLDHYIDHVDRQRRASTSVEDIPIE